MKKTKLQTTRLKKKEESTKSTSTESKVKNLESENQTLLTRLSMIEMENTLKNKGRYRYEKLSLLERLNENLIGVKDNLANIGKILESKFEEEDQSEEEDSDEEEEVDEEEDDEDEEEESEEELV